MTVVAKLAFYHLRNINCIRKYISLQKLDFCNSLLYGIPKKVVRRFQSVSKGEHITPILEGSSTCQLNNMLFLRYY